MQQSGRASSPSLSSPPSALSEPASPTRVINAGRANIEMDDLIIDPSSAARFGIMQTNPQQYSSEHPPAVQLTAAGLPRKKPGRKPGSTVKPKTNPDGTPIVEAPKQRRPRKPKDPNAPPIQRKRKAATGDGNETNSEMDARAASGPPPPAAQTATAPPAAAAPARLTSMRMSLDAQPGPAKAGFVQAPKRESTGSMQMQSLLNDDPPPKPAAPARQMFDPIRGNYDPVRETMVTRDPYGTGPLGSPRAPTTTQVVNRASASPSIASLVDPAPSIISPRPSLAYPTTASSSQARFQEAVSSVPLSPSNNIQSVAATNTSTPTPSMPKPTLAEARRPPPPPPAAAPQPQEVKTNSFTSMSSIPTNSAAASAISAPQSKKIAAVVQQDRREGSASKKARSNASSPKINSLKDGKDSNLPPLPGGHERSILDFGRAKPGEEVEAPSITLHIPLKAGENNKYVNFMRMAEERYGWDALHPRLAASRERKARIEAATLALEREKNGRESGDEEMEEDLQSDADNSNVEMGGMNLPLSGPEAPVVPAKPVRKKRNFKEDEYDKDDDFVDDSEMLWEEQAAASRDGFFVYSGPLIPEVEKPVVPEGPPKRGRGRGGRGSRGGGRGVAAAKEKDAPESSATGAATTTTTSGRGRGGGPGSRGGTVRKPRITKLEKEQRDREKAEREKLALLAKGVGIGGAPNVGIRGGGR
ncbi:histone promoter control protein 2 [Podospora fimiseda]|uniref:Histone promoter control protein 2 n=1 Tax=Podospora fimiseda TaxID=252190 RepID=A0AAN7BYM7_9PEZI|nr:histone promoter control protein 2 [Podospora fimiseda]